MVQNCLQNIAGMMYAVKDVKSYFIFVHGKFQLSFLFFFFQAVDDSHL
jgi:hypothetical protein